MILDSMDSIKLNQHSYLELINELEVAKQKALIKLKPKMVRKRNEIMRNVKIDNEEIYKLFDL